MFKLKKRFKTEVKNFFQFDIQSFSGFFSLLLSALALGIVVFLAWSLDIYYDEAYSYLNSGRVFNVWSIIQFRIANIHILNSLLITLSSLFFPYSDFAIRFPAILSTVLYISISLSLARQFKNGIILLALLLFFDELLLFHSLARGYGMCTTLLLAALYVWLNKEKFHNYLLWWACLSLAAFYANFVALPYLVCFSAYIYVFYLKFKKPNFSRKSSYWLIGLTALGLFGFIMVTLSGKPVYGDYTNDFISAVPMDLWLHFTAFSNPSWTSVFYVSSGFTLLLLILIFILPKQFYLAGIFLASFGLIAFLAWIGHKPLPTGRVLLPFWPVLVVTIVQLLEEITTRLKINKRLILLFNVLIGVVLVWNAWIQFDYKSINQASQDQWKLAVVALSSDSLDRRKEYQYYLEKDNLKNDLIENLLELDSDSSFRKMDYRFEIYSELGVLLISKENDLAESLELKLNYYNLQNELMETKVLVSNYLHNDQAYYWLPLRSVSFSIVEIQDLNFKLNLEEYRSIRKLNQIPWSPRKHYSIGTNNR